jgi:tetratricopeptide (TPR) repeat protein
LGGLPLALQLAGRAIAKAITVPFQWDPSLPRSFDAYRTALAERFSEVFQRPASGPIDPQQVRGLVGQTWELSLAVLDSRSIPEARPLLRLLSCFGDAPIPCGLLLNPAILAECELFAAMTGQRLWEVLTALDSSSLITLDATSVHGEVGPMAVVHPVVRDTNRAHPEVRDAADTYHQLVIDLLSDASAKMANQFQVGILVAHIADPLANPLTQSPGSAPLSLPGAKLRKLAIDTADDLNELAMYAHVEALYQAVLADDTRRVGRDHPDALATRQELALAQCDQGRFAEAEQALASILAIRKEQLGNDHPETLMTRNELARVWREQGRFAEAEQALASILGVREERLGRDRPETLRTWRELAFVWRRQGRFAEAEQALRSIRAVIEERLGSDHPETLVIRTELARTWSKQGQLAEAEQAYISVLAVRKEQLGSDHLNTLMTRQELALVWRDQGRLAEAEQALASVLAIREERLGNDHAYNVGTRQMLAVVWRKQGRLAEAEQALTSILATSKWLGSDNLFNLATQHELALVWRDQGRFTEAEQALTSVLAIREERLGSDHPDTIATRAAITELTEWFGII